MRSALILAITLPILAPALAVGGDNTTVSDKQKAEIRDKLLTANYMLGKLSKIKLEDKTFTLEVKNYIRIQNPDAYRAWTMLNAQYNAAFQRGNQAEMLKLQDQIKETKAKLYEEVTTVFELKASDNFQVRFQQLPEKDAEGKPITYNPVDVAKRKGKDGEPGYSATMDDLTTLQYVRVYLDRAKMTSESNPSSSKCDAPAEPVYPVSIILIQPPPKEAPPVQPMQPGVQPTLPETMPVEPGAELKQPKQPKIKKPKVPKKKKK